MADSANRPEVYGGAIRGARTEQQDAYRLRWIDSENAWLLVLADGMGGYAGGATASRITVDSFVAAFVAQRDLGATLEDAFQTSLNDANTRIARAQQAQPDLADMGTTIVAAYLSHEGIAWISVGDSPMWIVRGGNLLRLNQDHSLREIAGSTKNVRNMLQSALNGQPIAMVDCKPNPLATRAGDVLLIATDGILTLSEDEIAKTVAEARPVDTSVTTKALLDGVSNHKKPNQDNCSVIVVAYPQSGDKKPAGDIKRSGPSTRIVLLVVTAVLGALLVAATVYFFLLVR
jgi:protein phosphatase